MCSPFATRVLYRLHSSGRWFFGSHWPNSSRKENTRSLARAFSSSRRAPPMAASKPNSAIASNSVTDCAAFLLSSKRRSLTVPRRIESSTERTMSRSPSSVARPRSCVSRGGRARETVVGRHVQSAFARFPDLPPPAPGAPVLSRDRRPGAGRAADGTVALVVERVVGHLAGADVLPHLVLGPVGERIELDDAARGVEFLELQIGARDGLLAALARDPGFLALER